MEKLIRLWEESLEQNTFIDAVWSNPRIKLDQYEKDRKSVV